MHAPIYVYKIESLCSHFLYAKRVSARKHMCQAKKREYYFIVACSIHAIAVAYKCCVVSDTSAIGFSIAFFFKSN